MEAPDFDSDLFTLTQIQHLMRVEFNRAERYGYPIACLVVAVDRLGHLRDRHGYACKEAVLKHVVSLLAAGTRSSDHLGRLADDRLLAVVPHTGDEGARGLAERLLAEVRDAAVEWEAKRLDFTLSIGACTNEGGGTVFFDALLRAAEDAVHEASMQGGDRVVLAARTGAPDGGAARGGTSRGGG